MNMLLKSLFILFLAVAADKGKGKGNRQRGGDKEKGRGKGKGKGRGCGDLDATRVQGDMTELLKAFIDGNSETMYCRIRGPGYPFVDVPTSSSTTDAPQRRMLEQKKSATSFKVAGGAVATGLVKGCDDNTYCFPDITLSLTSAADDWTAAPASPRRNLGRGRRGDDEETVDTSSTEEPVATTATVTFSQSNPGEVSFSMAYTCAVDYEAETSTTVSPEGETERSTTCTPRGLKCRAKFTLDSEDKRAYMMCSSALSDDNGLEATIDSCPLPSSAE